MRVADGTTRPIEEYGDLAVVLWFGQELVPVLLQIVAHVPDLRHHLLCFTLCN